MEKKSVLNTDRSTVSADGDISVRVDKQELAIDGTTVLKSEPHRTTIPAGMDMDKALTQLTAGLAAWGYPPLSMADAATLKATAAAAWTKG